MWRSGQNVFILVGNIGTGKTTWIRRFLNQYHKNRDFVVIDNDSISTMLSGLGKYDWQEDKRLLYSELKKLIFKACLNDGYSVIIDGIHATVNHRKVYTTIAKRYKARIYILDFGGGTAESLTRRCKDNRGLPKSRWIKVHNFYKKLYTRPTLEFDYADTVVYNPYVYFNIRRK